MKLTNDQKRMAKNGIFQAITMAIIMVIIVPLIKGETLSMPDVLIGFFIFIGVFIIVYSIFIIGAMPPKK